jgi:hypothetical protein
VGDDGRVVSIPDHYLCLSVDVQGYSAHDDLRQAQIQTDLIALLTRAAARAGLDRGRWIRQAKGDEEVALLPAGEQAQRAVGSFCLELEAELRRHNSGVPGDERLRLRLGMDEGAVSLAANGFAGRAVIAACRLAASHPPRAAMSRHPEADLAVVLSDRVYEDWISTGRAAVRADRFRQTLVSEKGYQAVAWLWLPGISDPIAMPPSGGQVRENTGSAAWLRQGAESFRYARLARLAPGVLVALPPVVLALACLPVTGTFGRAAAVLAGAGALLFVTAQVVRDRGRRIEVQLFRRWGGRPTEVMLRWHGPESQAVVARRHLLVAEHLGIVLPDEKAEANDPPGTDQQYAAAVAALRERTRDSTRFPLVLQENIAYGFRRNAYACRLPALLACVFAAGATLLLGPALSRPQQAGLLAFDLAAALAWLSLCTQATVRRAADAYGRQLFASLEMM